MKRKLFVSNLDFDVTEEQLKEVFDTVGDTVSVVLATDRETKRSKGFAFVEMGSDELAEKAISELNDKEVNGRPIRVTEDRGKGGGSAPSASRGGPEESGNLENTFPRFRECSFSGAVRNWIHFFKIRRKRSTIGISPC